jgi:hypothetical protein
MSTETKGKFLITDSLVVSLLIFVLSFLDVFHLFICFCFFLDQLKLACGGTVKGVKGKEDLRKVKEIISQYPSLVNEGLDECSNTPLITVAVYNSVSVAEFLLLRDDIEVNKRNKV